MQKKEEKLLLIAVITGVLGLTSFVPSSAGEQATITATVTPELISVILNRPQIDYGAVALNSIAVSPSGEPITNVKNNGTVTENLNILGSDATFGTNTWQIGEVPAENQFVHESQKQAGDITWYKLSDTVTKPLAGNLAVNDFVDIKIRLSTPTSITGDYGQYSTTITVQAVKS